MTRPSVYAGFDSLLESEPAWRVGAVPDRGGELRELSEPEAAPIVQNGRLRMGAAVHALSRPHTGPRLGTIRREEAPGRRIHSYCELGP